MTCLQADGLPGSVPPCNCPPDGEHRIASLPPRGDLHGNFLPPLHFLDEGGEANWRSSVTSSPAGTRTQVSCPLIHCSWQDSVSSLDVLAGGMTRSMQPNASWTPPPRSPTGIGCSTCLSKRFPLQVPSSWGLSSSARSAHLHESKPQSPGLCPSFSLCF